MKLIIDIPEDIYKFVCQLSCEGSYHYDDVVLTSVKNGTPIPDNATNGDMIKAVFQQWKIIDDADKDMIMFNIPMKVGYEFNACSREWWNSQYQKGGK